MSLLLVLMACSTQSADPVVGCWDADSGRATECFQADGVYRLQSKKLGEFEGRWVRKGPEIEISVGSFAPDLYETRIDGDALVLAHKARGETAYTRAAP